MTLKNPNNPGNIKGGGPWKGLIGHDEQGHNIYDTRINGGRAMCRCIQQAILAGRDTIEKLVKGWTAVEADWEEYIRFICLKTGFSETRNIGFLTEFEIETGRGLYLGAVKFMVRLLKAMTSFEHGEDYGRKIPTSEYLEWIAAFSQDFLRD